MSESRCTDWQPETHDCRKWRQCNIEKRWMRSQNLMYRSILSIVCQMATLEMFWRIGIAMCFTRGSTWCWTWTYIDSLIDRTTLKPYSWEIIGAMSDAPRASACKLSLSVVLAMHDYTKQSNLVELSTKSFKDGRNCGFHLPLRKLSIMSSVAHLAAEPSSWTVDEALGPPLSISQTLRKF